MSAPAPTSSSPTGAFRHEMLFYAGDEGFAEGTIGFLREGVARREPTLVVVSAAKIDMLRSRLGKDAAQIEFADMSDVGANPARIIPAWRRFLSSNAGNGSALRGIGEPIWAGRSAAELIECQRHESLVNLAFDGEGPFRLLCPYDTTTLSPAVLSEARRSHPFVVEGAEDENHDYVGLDTVGAPFDAPLPEPPPTAEHLGFEAGPLFTVRRFAKRQAVTAGLTTERIDDFVIAVNEIVTNSVLYGDGHGSVFAWREPNALVCEIGGAGQIQDPLAGRKYPTADQDRGRGLWMVNQLCDLVQLRSFGRGTVVRLHMRTET